MMITAFSARNRTKPESGVVFFCLAPVRATDSGVPMQSSAGLRELADQHLQLQVISLRYPSSDTGRA